MHQPTGEQMSIYDAAMRYIDQGLPTMVFGGEERWVDVPLNSTPLFVRGGSILPLAPVRMNSGTPLTRMDLHLYVDDAAASGSLYEDAGDGFGASVLKSFAFVNGTLTQTRVGEFTPAYGTYRVHLVGLEEEPKSVSIDGGAKMKLKPGLPVELPEGFTEAIFG